VVRRWARVSARGERSAVTPGAADDYEVGGQAGFKGGVGEVVLAAAAEGAAVREGEGREEGCGEESEEMHCRVSLLVSLLIV
jgi:hypothetical protein